MSDVELKKIAFFNPQGNFDRNDSHLAEHPDFGGQLVYVKALAKAIASKGIQVDIITRQIIDKDWPEFLETIDYYPDTPNLRIIRILFGGKQFLRKEDLWKHLPEYVNGIIRFYKQDGNFPDFVTTHYGDGGISGVIFLHETGVPFSFTAHSLGAWKLEKLLKNGAEPDELERKYKFSIRILAENLSIKYSSFVTCSTTQERYEQYSHKLYETDPYNDKFKVIPPGINHKIFTTQEQEHDKLIEKYIDQILSKLSLRRQKLPFFVMSSRVDRKKNHIAVVRAFMKDERLRQAANLFIVVRGIDNIEKYVAEHNNEEAEVLKEILETAGDEVGNSVFFINITDQASLAAFYRMAAKRDSVFVLPATYEPFGLAIVEAAACGLKVVATKNGGPSEILSNGEGLLIDPEDLNDIATKLYVALEQFDNTKSLLLAKKYSWERTAKLYLENIQNALSEEKKDQKYDTIAEDLEKFRNMISF